MATIGDVRVQKSVDNECEKKEECVCGVGVHFDDLVLPTSGELMDQSQVFLTTKEEEM
jgi:hypothetical protein